MFLLKPPPTGFDSFRDVKDITNLPDGEEQRKYRQYMNRRGGFNRPLEETGGSGF